MEQGVYERVVTKQVQKAVDTFAQSGLVASVQSVDEAERAGVLSEQFARVLRGTLREVTATGENNQQVNLYNALLLRLQDLSAATDLADYAADPPVRHLRLVWPASTSPPERPDSPLANGTLLTGTRLDPSLVSQLRKELETADQVDILCSFIKWGGIRVLEDELKQFTSRAGVALRVITTSYLGATDLKAIEFLRELPNTSIRVSYDTHRTRLHAKAYIVRRKTGFGSAYIGSANLSQAALTDGLEWTVKVSQYEQLYLWEKATATFETYWNDAEFESYEAGDRDRLDAALQSERGGGEGASEGVIFFDLRPYAFQQEILDKIQAERDLQGRTHHLVVAATGTGKTMVAAFDYRRAARSAENSGRPRLLFVAHREEILRQSAGAFRAVLRDQNFGDLLVGGYEPAQRDHLFVSIQSYNSREMWRLPPEHYEYVVVDEFHHAAAESYRRLIDHVKPKVLLGLTATPERADGIDVMAFFDGHVTAEIRLADAINRKLLSPFQYFGITDSEDLSGLRWSRGGYRQDELDHLFTGNDIRAQLVIQKTGDKVLNIRRCRGLGFCVSIGHAEFMARKFRDAGVPAEALSAQSSDEHRRTVQKRLVAREINFIFVVDLYNEGVDMAEPGDGEWVLLANLAFSVTHRMQSDEIDIIAVGPPGVRVIEVKHWNAEWINERGYDLDREADLVTSKARKVGTTLRKELRDLPRVDGAFLLTQEPAKIKRLVGQSVRGVTFFGLAGWKDALGLGGGTVLRGLDLRLRRHAWLSHGRHGRRRRPRAKGVARRAFTMPG